MTRIASEVLIERLADWGVDTVFGLPGDGINGPALHDRQPVGTPRTSVHRLRR
jgi:hypothetical protein